MLLFWGNQEVVSALVKIIQIATMFRCLLNRSIELNFNSEEKLHVSGKLIHQW